MTPIARPGHADRGRDAHRPVPEPAALRIRGYPSAPSVDREPVVTRFGASAARLSALSLRSQVADRSESHRAEASSGSGRTEYSTSSCWDVRAVLVRRGEGAIG